MTQAPLPTVTDLLAPLVDVDDRGVFFEDSYVHWRDHLRHGAAIAATLRERLAPGRPPHVGVLLENTPFFSAVLVAAGMSGIVPVGLNPVRRGAALQRDIDHADCQLVLADTKSAATLTDIEHIDVDSAAWADEVAAHRDADIQFQSALADDLFMLIYTSGTSGDPKAVMCSHGKVAVAGVTMSDRFGLGASDVCYASMPLFHSNAVLVGWAVALACRGSMALRRKFSASQFFPDVRRYGATYANYVGKPLSYVLATPERPDDADNPLRAVYGNEGAPADVDRFASRFHCRVVDGFGSTEGGIAIGRTPETPSGALGPLPDGTEVIDVDTGQPCSVGVIGELVNVDGPGRFEGYYNDPEANAQRMAGGMYHSGDLAYRDEAGYAYFAGRLGDWLRVDGENLGTAPIERVLARYPDVTEVAVYAVPDPAVGDQVMAAVVLATGADLDTDKFRAFLAEQPDLGPKQWPSYVRVSTGLPRTATLQDSQAATVGRRSRLRRPGVADSPVIGVDGTLQKSFDDLSNSLQATVGIAVATAGRNPVSLGAWTSGVAWSTIKVPLAIAALAVDNADLVFKTITLSDNAAAEELWSRLGDSAAQSVQAVIRDAGDPTTVVESRRLRPEYTPFGQTRWSLTDQATFAAGLSRVAEASRVIDLMGDLSADHCWGLAADGIAAKGGWGPGIADDYLVRQFGIVSGTVGVALAAEVGDGGYEAGVDVVNSLTDWLVERLPELTDD